jgi:CDP-glycerol glycerophosphotransferase
MIEKVIQALVFPVIFFVSILMPKRNDIWLFSAWFGRRFEDSPRALFEELHIQCGLGIRPYWVYKGPRPTHPDIAEEFFVSCYSLRGLILQLRARVFTVCVNSRDFWPGCITPRNFVVQTWHGTPMKQIGYQTLRKKKLGIAKFWLRRYLTESYDIVLSPSDYTDAVFCEAFQLPKDRLLRFGYPRNSAMYLSDARRLAIRNQLFTRDEAFIWLYLPTHRSEGADADSTRYGYNEILSLSSVLTENGIAVAFRPHFYEAQLLNDLEETASVYILPMNSQWSLYEILGAADGLITDYSSVAYDFAERSDNIILFEFDLQDYKSRHRDLLRVPDEDFENCVTGARELGDLLVNLSKSRKVRKFSMTKRSSADLLRVIKDKVEECRF